eukprot:Rhum_TRINITY_DN9179_c0_g2::Rhum_TRINITY_DN9179_c0_g2_i1::g.31938::m.31938
MSKHAFLLVRTGTRATPILAYLCLVQAQHCGDTVNSAARAPEREVAVRRRLAVSGGWRHVALPVVRRVPGSCLLARRRAIRLRKERKRRRRRNPFPLHQKLVSGTTALPCVLPPLHYTRGRDSGKRGEKGEDMQSSQYSFGFELLAFADPPVGQTRRCLLLVFSCRTGSRGVCLRPTANRGLLRGENRRGNVRSGRHLRTGRFPVAQRTAEDLTTPLAEHRLHHVALRGDVLGVVVQQSLGPPHSCAGELAVPVASGGAGLDLALCHCVDGRLFERLRPRLVQNAHVVLHSADQGAESILLLLLQRHALRARCVEDRLPPLATRSVVFQGARRFVRVKVTADLLRPVAVALHLLKLRPGGDEVLALLRKPLLVLRRTRHSVDGVHVSDRQPQFAVRNRRQQLLVEHGHNLRLIVGHSVASNVRRRAHVPLFPGVLKRVEFVVGILKGFEILVGTDIVLKLPEVLLLGRPQEVQLHVVVRLVHALFLGVEVLVLDVGLRRAPLQPLLPNNVVHDALHATDVPLLIRVLLVAPHTFVGWVDGILFLHALNGNLLDVVLLLIVLVQTRTLLRRRRLVHPVFQPFLPQEVRIVVLRQLPTFDELRKPNSAARLRRILLHEEQIATPVLAHQDLVGEVVSNYVVPQQVFDGQAVVVLEPLVPRGPVREMPHLLADLQLRQILLGQHVVRDKVTQRPAPQGCTGQRHVAEAVRQLAHRMPRPTTPMKYRYCSFY